MARRPNSRLAKLVARLEEHYGKQIPPPPRNAFELVLWEKVAYLADDAKRAKAFDALRRRVGLTPVAILDADLSILREIAALGGSVAVIERAQRMRDAAELVIGEFDGDLGNATRLPIRDAKRALKKIYGIADPGAERILLLTRAHKCFPLESNGLRTLVRVGYGVDHKNYTTMYRGAIDAATPELVDDFDWLIGAHLVLRHHGQETCKTGAPRCAGCPVRSDCAFGRAS
jgi:endonuclease-3